MKYISFVELEYFKRHKHLRQEFDPYFNVIVGASDSGKSTLNVAIKKCLLNEPDVKGESFLTWGAPRGSKTSIKVGIKNDDNGQLSFEEAPEVIIERILGKGSVNEYNVYWPNGKVDNYARFGKDVPPEILKIHGMREADLGYAKENLNFQAQFDGFFLTSKRPQDVAKALGQIAQTEVVDMVKSELSSDIANKQRKVKQGEVAIAKEADQIKTYEYLGELGADLDAVEGMLDMLDVFNAKTDAVEFLKAKTGDHIIELERLTRLYGYSFDFAGLDRDLQKSISLKEMADVCNDVYESAEDNIGKLANCKAIIESAVDSEAVYKACDQLTSNIELRKSMWLLFDEAEKQCQRLAGVPHVKKNNISSEDFEVYEKQVQDLNDKKSDVTRIKEDTVRFARRYATAIEMVAEAEKKKQEARNKLSEATKGDCPLCGEPMEGKSIEDIMLHASAL